MVLGATKKNKADKEDRQWGRKRQDGILQSEEKAGLSDNVPWESNLWGREGRLRLAGKCQSPNTEVSKSEKKASETGAKWTGGKMDCEAVERLQRPDYAELWMGRELGGYYKNRTSRNHGLDKSGHRRGGKNWSHSECTGR